MRYVLSMIFIFAYIIGSTQTSPSISDSRIGLLKTESGNILGYGFVAMNKSVVFTAAHNISFQDKMIFEDSEGNTHSLRVVATDKVGDIGVLMANGIINEKPFGLNLNYEVDQETVLYTYGSKETNFESSKIDTELTGKSSKIEKKKEFKTINLTIQNAPKYTGYPILNANDEAIGIVIDFDKGANGSKECKVSVMDSNMWKKM